MKYTAEYKLINQRIEEMDLLKGFSIFTIVLMHLMNYMDALPSPLLKLSLIGGTGVHVFFFCSGIGLYLSFLNKRLSYVEFLRRRFYKIYIPYIVVVVISFLAPWMYSGKNRIMALLSHIFLFKMFIPEYESSFGQQLWFISTIVQFYLIFIPMCHIKEKINNSKIFFGIFFGLSVMWWFVCYILGVSDSRVWSSFCFQYIWEFALGLVVAGQLYEGKIFRINKIMLSIIAVIGIGLMGGMALLSDKLKLFNDIPAFFGYIALALLLINISFIRLICRFISQFSYELYLVHIIVIESVLHIVNPQGLRTQLMVGIVALIIAMVVGLFYNKLLGATIFRKR